MNDDRESRLRWFAPWRQAARAPQDDAADLGTAFGLDLSMAPESAPPPSRLSSRDNARSEHWYDRLSLRRG